jgi:glutathione S-transferase
LRYLSVAQARESAGLRLVVTVGVPGPWSESAKKLFEFKGLAYQPVAQYLNEDNADLKAWVGVRNAPVAVTDAAPPATHWREVLQLAEDLAPFPALLPAEPQHREAALRVCAAICGERGFGWWRRLMLIELARQLAPADPATDDIQRGYGFDTTNTSQAPAQVAAALQALAARLHRQQQAGSEFLVGCDISACDIYWACFSLMVKPLPERDAPMPAVVRQFYASSHPLVDAAFDPILLAHRDRMFQHHLTLPLDF